jgi:hypothetical protein
MTLENPPHAMKAFMQWLRAVAAFVLVPFFIPGVFWAASAFFISDDFRLADLPWLLMASAAVTLPATLLIGVPAFLFFRENDRLPFRYCVSTGALIGTVAYALYVGLLTLEFHFELDPLAVGFGVVMGALGGIVFWAIVNAPTITRRRG